MEVGIFGKLPARRDYVQQGLDRRLMAVIDPWLQAGVAASRAALGEGWLDAWLCAPIWRFWLGRRIAGRAAMGAMMPSVDGVGRYFPLCVIGMGDDLPPPEMDDQARWFEALEALMLGALAEGGSYEALLAGLGSLPVPNRQEGAAGWGRKFSEVGEAFASLRMAKMAELFEAHSCWWVPSPDGVTPMRGMIRHGMPDAGEYATLIAPPLPSETIRTARAGAS